MAASEAQADLDCQPEKISDELSEIEGTNEDHHVLSPQTDHDVDTTLDSDVVSSQDSIPSQDKEFYRLLHRASQTLEKDSTVKENIGAEKLLISWDEIPIASRKNESLLIKSPPSPPIKPETSGENHLLNKNSVKQ